MFPSINSLTQPGWNRVSEGSGAGLDWKYQQMLTRSFVTFYKCFSCFLSRWIGPASSTRSEQVPASENEAVGHRGRHAGPWHRPAYGSGASGETQHPNQVVKGGAFEGTMNGPFGHGYGEGAGEGIDEVEWVVARDKPMYDEIFYTLSPVNGKVTGANAKKELVKSKLPNTVLGKIWKLADIDKDGMLDDEEFALANHLIKVKLEGHELPSELPAHLVPPSKRKVPE